MGRGYVLQGEAHIISSPTNRGPNPLVHVFAVVGGHTRLKRTRGDAGEIRDERRGVAETLGGEFESELDRNRPDPEAVGESVEPEAGVGGATLADEGPGGSVRGGDGAWG